MTDNGLILPSFDLLHLQAEKVKELTAPLRQCGITMFSHTRVYKDNTFLDISDRSDMLDYFYYQTDIYKHYTPDINPWLFDNEFFLCSSLGENLSTAGLRSHLAIDNIIILIEKYQNHCELWHFGADPSNADITNFYINNLSFLKKFTIYFKSNAKKIINASEKHKIKRSDDIVILENNANCSKKIEMPIQDISFNYKGALITFSKRETEVLKWIILGKTATETGIILSISSRTVEHYLDEVKKKLGSSKLLDVFRILATHKIIDAIMDL